MLVVQELSGREGGRPDRLFRDVQPGNCEPGPQVSRRVYRVVRQDEKWSPALAQGGQEVRGARNRHSFVDEDAVHIGQPACDFTFRHAHSLPDLARPGRWGTALFTRLYKPTPGGQGSYTWNSPT